MDLTLQNSNPLKRTFRIIGLYIFGTLCFALFIYMDNSQDLNDFLKKADRVRTDWGFGFYLMVGLIKFVSLISGVTIPIILTIMLLRENLKKNAL